jgi:hypothetical protein
VTVVATQRLGELVTASTTNRVLDNPNLRYSVREGLS